MKKKLLSILLSLAMVVTMMPAMTMTVSAATLNFGVYVLGTRVTNANKNDVLNDGTVKFIPDSLSQDTSGTLILDGANLTRMGNLQDQDYIIKTEEGMGKLTIKVSSDSTLKSEGNYPVRGIMTTSDLEISGNGTLNINTNNTGISVQGASFKQNGNVKIISEDSGIVVNVGSFLQESGKLETTSVCSSDGGLGVGLLVGNSSFNISGGEIIAKGSTATGLFATGGIYLLNMDSTKLRMTGGKVTVEAGNGLNACGIGSTFGMEISGGEIIATASYQTTAFTPMAKGLPPIMQAPPYGEGIIPVTISEDISSNAIVKASANVDGSNAEAYDSTKIPTMGYKYIHVYFEEEDNPPTPGPTVPTEEYTVPVEAENSVQIETNITNGNAEVKEITKESLDKVAKSEDGKSTTDTIKIDLSKAQQDVKGVVLTKPTVKNLADVTASKDNDITSVEIALTKASVTLDAKALKAINEQANGDTIQLVVDDTKSDNLNTAQQSSLKDYKVSSTFEAYFESNGQRIHDFKGGIATVSMKFEPAKGKNANNYKVYYIEETGKMVKYATKYANGLLKFATTHFSDYAIVYDTSVNVLLLNGKTSGSKAVKLSWNGIDNASKYVIYGAKCGNNFKKLKTLKGKSYTVKKIAGKSLSAHKAYKFYVVGYDAVGNKVKSKTIHFVTANTQGKYANVKSIKAKYDEMLLSVGISKKIGATYKMYSGKKHLKKGHGAALRYISTNTEVAKVNSSGKVIAVGAGTAIIYIQDIGGKYCKTKVTVE